MKFELDYYKKITQEEENYVKNIFVFQNEGLMWMLRNGVHHDKSKGVNDQSAKKKIPKKRGNTNS